MTRDSVELISVITFGHRAELFIEDDDSPRGLNNLVKYWRWSRLNEDIHPVYLVHILNTDRGVWANHCKFIGMRMEEEMGRKKFRYLPMSVDNKWHDHETWLPHLKIFLMRCRKLGRAALLQEPISD